MKYVTDKEIHVCGLQRTGQHAILTWTIGHFNKVFYRNGITPFQDKAKRGITDGKWWYFDTEEHPDFTWEVGKKLTVDQDAIILGTEYVWPNMTLNPKMDLEKEEIAASMGCDEFSKEKHYILVIRSPYNHLASYMKMKGPTKMAKRFSKCWIACAEEFLNITNNIPSPKVGVAYDHWFSDKSYREGMSKRLNIPFSDRGTNTVMRIGQGKTWGSSFDKMEYKDCAQKMQPLNRWIAYKDDPFFKKAMSNDKLRDLSEKIFGEFPKDI